jgi:hypothetical protein
VALNRDGAGMNRHLFLRHVWHLAVSLAVLASSLSPGERVLAQGQSFSRIVVDTRPLEARGAGAAAAILRQELQAALNREFAGRLGRGGPVLIVRLQTVSLGPFAGPGGSGERGFSSSDYLEGDVSAGSARFPMFVTQDSSAGGAWFLPDNDARRLRALADQFAGWVRRKV